MMLDYLALFLLIVIIGLVVYGVVAIYGIPYEIAKARHHPHQDAIRAATWVSLFTLGVLWPFLWIWALMYDPEHGWDGRPVKGSVDAHATIAQLNARVSALEKNQQVR
jgi:hypothetical protein